jgi:hypothetical protein
MIDRGVAGMVLMVIGAICACYWGVFRPAGFGGQLAAFFFCVIVFGAGVWLFMRRSYR